MMSNGAMDRVGGAADVRGGEGKSTTKTATNYSHTLAGHVLAPREVTHDPHLEGERTPYGQELKSLASGGCKLRKFPVTTSARDPHLAGGTLDQFQHVRASGQRRSGVVGGGPDGHRRPSLRRPRRRRHPRPPRLPLRRRQDRRTQAPPRPHRPGRRRLPLLPAGSPDIILRCASIGSLACRVLNSLSPCLILIRWLRMWRPSRSRSRSSFTSTSSSTPRSNPTLSCSSYF
jgi:hypothetical protein